MQYDGYIFPVPLSPIIVNLLKGYQRPYDWTHPKAKNLKLPVLLEMALKSDNYSTKVGYECMVVAVHFPTPTSIDLRFTEFLKEDSKKKTDIASCKRADIKFFDDNEEVIPYPLIGHTTAQREFV